MHYSLHIRSSNIEYVLGKCVYMMYVCMFVLYLSCNIEYVLGKCVYMMYVCMFVYMYVCLFVLYLSSAPEKEKSQSAHVAVFVVDHAVDLVACKFQREQLVKKTVCAGHHSACSYSTYLNIPGLGLRVHFLEHFLSRTLRPSMVIS